MLTFCSSSGQPTNKYFPLLEVLDLLRRIRLLAGEVAVQDPSVQLVDLLGHDLLKALVIGQRKEGEALVEAGLLVDDQLDGADLAELAEVR